MSAARALGRVLLVSAALAAIPSSAVLAQAAPANYEVRKGDGLYAISGKFRPEGLTRFQVAIGIYRANLDAFPEGNINLLKEGQLLRIPNRDELAATAPAEASRQWQALTAKWASPPQAVASVAPAPLAKPPARPSVGTPRGAEAAAKRYREGVALEREGNHQGALTAYLEAGEAGNGLAQRRLGQIYDTGSAAVQRDYQLALKWYQRAREQGIEMDKPLQRTLPK